jgi:RNA binding activity-knot of a chromodomain
MSHSIHREDDLPGLFDEFEQDDNTGLVMRTVVDFELILSDGSFIGIDKLGLGGQKATLVGYVVEPLKPDVKESVSNLLCTSSQHLPTEAELAVLLPIAQKRKKVAPVSNSCNEIEILPVNNNGYEMKDACQKEENGVYPLLDQSSLKIGDNIDGYCVKTFRWYEAKVVDMKKGDQKGEAKFRIHFSGWNAKHDEWIPVGSDRIAARGSSSSIVLAAAKTASSLVPWWTPELALLKAKAALQLQDKDSHSSSSNSSNNSNNSYDSNSNSNISSSSGSENEGERKKIPVRIENIEDWCIDYTYANPSLWLIASSGVWYRVAGPMCVGAMQGRGQAHRGYPSRRYESIFEKTCCEFLSSVHVAMCLLDFLPSTPKLSLQFMCGEISARSQEEVDEIDILQNYRFIAGEIILNYHIRCAYSKLWSIYQMRVQKIMVNLSDACVNTYYQSMRCVYNDLRSFYQMCLYSEIRERCFD